MHTVNSRTQPSWELHEPPTSTQTFDPLEVIYIDGQWRLHMISPLNDFQYNAVKLKQYGSKIRQSVVSMVTASSSVKYDVVLKEMTDLKYSEEEPNAIMITISSTQESTNKPKAVYTAILLSWGEYIKVDGAVHLPYMIERGDLKLSTVVYTTLQKIFDCSIKRLNFTQSQLLQLGFHCLELDSSSDLSECSLHFRTPKSDLKNKLNVRFSLRDMKLIWNGAKEEVSNGSELVRFAYQILQAQILHVATLDVAYLELCEFILPRAEIRNNGMVKMKTPEIINCVFASLNKMCHTNKW